MAIDVAALGDLAVRLRIEGRELAARSIETAIADSIQAQEEAASWRRTAERLAEENSAERERLAQLVREMADTTPLTKARPALILAASLVRRGRHLTEAEKLTNLVNGMAEFDPNFAASIAERAGLEIERTRFGMDFGQDEEAL